MRGLPGSIRSAVLANFLLLALVSPPARAAGPNPELDVTTYQVVYQVPEMAKVQVKKDVLYKTADGTKLLLDVYQPSDLGKTIRAAVVFINGVGNGPNGPKLKDWGQYTSWPKLMAAHGYIGVSFDARGGRVDEDIRDLFRYLEANAATFGIDPSRIGAWACSANVRPALTYLMGDAAPGIKAAVLYYGNGTAAKLRADLPVLQVRAGRDAKAILDGIAALQAQAIAENVPWSLINAPDLAHAFDGLEDTDSSRRVIRQTIEFFDHYLRPPPHVEFKPSLARQSLIHQYGQEPEKAEAALRALLEKTPDDPVVLQRLGMSALTRGNFQEAVTLLERSVERAPDNAQARYGVGVSYLMTQQDKKAVKALEQAVKLGFRVPHAYYNLGCAYARTGKKKDAIDALGKAIDAGFADRKALLEDPDLASLREDARFQALSKRLE